MLAATLPPALVSHYIQIALILQPEVRPPTARSNTVLRTIGEPLNPDYFVKSLV